MAHEGRPGGLIRIGLQETGTKTCLRSSELICNDSNVRLTSVLGCDEDFDNSSVCLSGAFLCVFAVQKSNINQP